MVNWGSSHSDDSATVQRLGENFIKKEQVEVGTICSKDVHQYVYRDYI